MLPRPYNLPSVEPVVGGPGDMNCEECGKSTVTKTATGSAWVAFCSDSCRNAFNTKRERYHAELRDKPWKQTPDILTLSDFEEFALKVAIHTLADPSQVEDIPIWLRKPELLALRIKEVLVDHLPIEYVRTWTEGSSLAKQDCYSFTEPIPRDLLFDAMRKAGLAS